MNSIPIVEINGLRYAYPDGTVALDGVDLVVGAGEKLGIIGANGAGKSTLLLHLNGVLRGEGLVRLLGMELDRNTVHQLRQRVGLVFQNPEDQLFCTTVFDDVAFGPRNMKLPEEEVQRRVVQALQAVGLGGLEQKSPYRLSVGQKKRAALATVLSMDAELLVLDEPTSNLDPRGRRELVALLRQLDHTQMIATHDLNLVRDLCTRVVLLDAGKIVADGASETVLNDRALLEAHGL